MLEKHYLDDLFHPESIAVIGASERAAAVGRKVFNNLLRGHFVGSLYPVNPKHKRVLGRECYSSASHIPGKIDLAILTTPALTIPTILKECGEKGIRTVIIISAGFSEMGVKGKELEQSLLDIAKQYNIHFIGPNCLGIMRPSSHLNATFDNNFALPGDIALLSQSGAICAGILDWAMDKEIGFSTIVSMGNSVDLDFGDILHYLALDPATKSILLYIEGVHYPRRFISGLRAAARLKPVIAIKAGRHASGVRAVHSHTGALVGDDDVFTAALNRGGAVRVSSIEQLFTAAQVLSSRYRAQGNRLTIITNGGGAGVMAADRAADLNIDLPLITEKTLSELNQVLPLHWSHQNPIDILGDATPERYRAVMETCFNEVNNDALLAILVPVAMSKPYEVAKEICLFAQKNHKPLLVSWIGEKQVKSSFKLFSDHKIPCYNTPEVAVEAFSYLVDYHINQQQLLQVPEPLFKNTDIDLLTKGAELSRRIIENALSAQRNILTTIESKQILEAFGVPVSKVVNVESEAALDAAIQSIGFPLVMKINSPDITHKQDVGGIKLNIKNIEELRLAYVEMMDSVKMHQPKAQITGVTLERMYDNPNNRELIIGILNDKVFGPVIVFGAGGSLVEIMQDRAIALPPLNEFLAKQLISRTRASKLLGEFRGKPVVDIKVLIDILMRISEMICQLPQIQEMDINPLLIDDAGAVVVDARFVIAPATVKSNNYVHMAIHPYPSHLVSQWKTKEGVDFTIRPIRPEDARLEQAFIKHLSSSARYFRFMHSVKELTNDILVRFTQIDYESEMAFVATCQRDNEEKMIGVVQYYTQGDMQLCEFAIVVADDWHNKGVGSRLMLSIIEAAKSKGIEMMYGRILSENTDMLTLMRYLGFSIASSEDVTIKIASLELNK